MHILKATLFTSTFIYKVVDLVIVSNQEINMGYGFRE